ncbi:MAG TPA: hypothetical protein VF978_04985 [Gemmatimonadales bacterium]
MTHRLSLRALPLLLLACTPPSPVVPGPPGPQPEPPVVQPVVLSPILLRPVTVRYVIHRRLRVDQELAGQPPTLLSYRVFISTAIAGPSDSSGYSVVHTVDSIIPDSGSYQPPTVNFVAAKGLRFTGRLAPNGAVRDATPSDSVVAQQFSQFLGNLRDFYPRLPLSGLVPGAAWTDTITTTDRAAGGEVQVRATHQSTVTGWETRAGAQCLRIEVKGTFTLQGVGEQQGQPYELMGNGTRSAVEFVSVDGRYVEGETRDSMSLAVSLPAQGLTVPIRQVVHSSVAVLP